MNTGAAMIVWACSVVVLVTLAAMARRGIIGRRWVEHAYCATAGEVPERPVAGWGLDGRRPLSYAGVDQPSGFREYRWGRIGEVAPSAARPYLWRSSRALWALPFGRPRPRGNGWSWPELVAALEPLPNTEQGRQQAPAEGER